MVMMVFRTSLEHEVLPWVDQEQLPYTRLDGAQGKGTTGTVPGSVTWGGGANSILLVVVPDDRLNSFRDRVRAFERELESQQRAMGVPFHILPCPTFNGCNFP
jgi:hypothetical protein